MKETKLKVIISGGGTGGHIFPAISIANALREAVPTCEVLFIGAQDRMEMQRIPQAGYKIVGLPVKGFNRTQIWKNISVVSLLIKSLFKARKTIKEFNPDVVVGVGGFASGPTLKMAEMLGIPTLIQEQNSYAGVTNKLLAKGASKICVAYPKMEQFFKVDKIVLTGNPVRQDILTNTMSQEEAKHTFKFDSKRPVVLILGGSLGAQSINNALLGIVDELGKSSIQFIWQTGKLYIDRVRTALEEKELNNVIVTDFITDMSMAYRAADLIVSRAGASSISEFSLLGKPVLLIPSPNVAEDHQTKNALALVDNQAALWLKDNEIKDQLFPLINETINNKALLNRLSQNIKRMALPNSADNIAAEVLKLVK